MMDTGERKGWMKIISVNDLDSHMTAIGQAEANAEIVNQIRRGHNYQKCILAIRSNHQFHKMSHAKILNHVFDDE